MMFGVVLRVIGSKVGFGQKEKKKVDNFGH